MERRFITAIILSIFVIITFQLLFPRPQKSQPMVQKTTRVSVEKETLPIESSQENKFGEKETIVETEKYTLTFTNIGGSLKDIKLKEYAEADTGSPFHLVSGAEKERAVFSMTSNVLTAALDKREFSLIKREKNSITYSYSIQDLFKIIKRYYFYNTNDYIELQISIQNVGSSIIYRDYDLLGGSSLKSANSGMERRLTEINSIVNGSLIRSTRVKNGDSFTGGIVSWTGVKGRYFCIILKPREESSEGIILKQFDNFNLASGIRAKRLPIYPGQTIEDSYILYIGPNDVARLNTPELGLGQIINYGLFDGITKFLLSTLRIFHKGVKNWGVAVILLTFLINTVLFPLTRKSFLSMRKIQEIQPHIEKLRSIHKDNPQKLNKELAELYRQYNINPFGGCLPLLLQLPVFFALYQGLIRSIELKGANFLWIKDLSNPDYVRIPLRLPVIGNEIHILPLLMIGAMFLQQKFSTKGTPVTSKEQEQQQKIMLIFFPLFFGFLFYNFPSGLVLYWLTNTILMIVEHLAIRKSLSGR